MTSSPPSSAGSRTTPDGDTSPPEPPAAEVPSPPDPLAALTRLRDERRGRRRAGHSRADRLYQIYVTVLLFLMAASTASSWIGDAVVADELVPGVVDDLVAWGGLVVALVVAAGLRSGAHGGPLTIDGAEVHHVLRSPLDRRATLGGPARRFTASALGGGALTGALVGMLIAQRVPGGTAGWMSGGALAGLTTAAAGVGAALCAAGVRLRPGWATLLGGALVASSVAVVAGSTGFSPTAEVAGLLVWVDHGDPLAVASVPVAASLLGLGHLLVPGTSLERLHHRGSVVEQIRFAIARRDLRTAVLLRRRLVAELPRRHPWLRRLPGPVRRHWPVLTRDLRGVLRWPAPRIARLAALSVMGGLALRGAWEGSTPLVVVAGVTWWVAGLDVVEPLAQELDHPTRLRAFPRAEGTILLRHLIVPVLVMLGLYTTGAATALALDPSRHLAEVLAVTAVPAAVLAVGGAALAMTADAYGGGADDALALPELSGTRIVFRMAWPPALAVAGLVPLLPGRSAVRSGTSPVPVTVNVASILVVVGVCVFAWIRHRPEIRQQLASAAGAGGGGGTFAPRQEAR